MGFWGFGDLMIAHPPCTYLANSGNKHLYIGGRKENGRNEERWAKREEALMFVRLLMGANIPKICVENPISCISTEIRKPDQIVQPWMFGDPFTKPTCLWLKGLPLLEATDIVNRGEKHVTKSGKQIPVWYNLPPSEDRAKIRSATFPGFAKAMADQWS